MSGHGPRQPPAGGSLSEPPWVRWLLIGTAVVFLGSLLVLPLAVVLVEAVRHGLSVFAAALRDSDAQAAIRLTLIAAGAALLLNTIFGIAIAWAVTRFAFPGKALLLTILDLPVAVSPVIAGMLFLLLFGAQGWAEGRPVAWAWPGLWWSGILATVLAAGALAWRRFRHARPARWPWLLALLPAATVLAADTPLRAWLAAGNDIPVVFALPGIILATAFVTVPYVARELIPVMQAGGSEEEQAAMSLGAGGWTIFLRITLPKVRWGLVYGMLLCGARAMGEFGAVSVVSGHIRGETTTLPLHIEILFSEYQFSAAFACASLLAVAAVATLGITTLIEHLRHRRDAQEQP